MRASCRCRWQATGPGSSLWCRHPAGPQAARTRGRHRRRPLPPPAAAGEQLRGAWLNEQLRRVGVCAALPAAGRSAGASEQGALGLGEQPAGRFQGAARVCKQQLAARASRALLLPASGGRPLTCVLSLETPMELWNSTAAGKHMRAAGLRARGVMGAQLAGGRCHPRAALTAPATWKPCSARFPPVPGHRFS